MRRSDIEIQSARTATAAAEGGGYFRPQRGRGGMRRLGEGAQRHRDPGREKGDRGRGGDERGVAQEGENTEGRRRWRSRTRGGGPSPRRSGMRVRKARV